MQVKSRMRAIAKFRVKEQRNGYDGSHTASAKRVLTAVLIVPILASSLVFVVNPHPAFAAPPAAPATSTLNVSANGTQVSMTFTQDLHPNIATKEQFKVTIGTYAAPTTRTVDVPVTAVTRTTARIITLTLGGVIDQNKPPLVAYTAPPNVAGTDNLALQNLAGEDVASFSLVSTGTQSLVPGLLSSTPPTLQATGNTLVLTYSIDIATTLPAPSAFTVMTTTGGENPVLTVTRPTTRTVTLTLRDGVESGTRARHGNRRRARRLRRRPAA